MISHLKLWSWNLTKRVLIVDDENFIRLLLRRTLEDLEFEGVELLTASDGIEGLQVARETKPDLIFLDLMMPGMSGEQVCAALRGDPTFEQTHIIILTAKGQATEFPEGLGPDEYLTKPFDPDHIVDLAATVLGVELDFEV